VKVAALEIPARFDRVSENLALVDSLLSRGQCDLALLPEASLTGYVSPRGDFDLTRFAEPKDGPTARALADLARKHRTHLVGPLVERGDRGIYNAMIGFDPEGREWLHFRKRHPWYPETWATPGTEIAPIVRIRTISFTVAVCFDVHFGEWPRADVLLFPSAWVEEEDSRAELLSKVGMHVVNANWGIGEPRVPGQGDSCILHASGAVLAKGGPRIDAEIQ
jgi:predicted amidohydrolase